MAPKIVLVTGANQGLGFAVGEVAGSRSPENTYILCSRDVAKGSEAVKKLQEQGVTAPIHFHQLDVTNDEEITALADYVDKMYGRVDGEKTPPAPQLDVFPLKLTNQHPKPSLGQQRRYPPRHEHAVRRARLSPPHRLHRSPQRKCHLGSRCHARLHAPPP